MMHRFTKLRIAGFSLVELMIVVAILGILAATVYPKFQDNVHKTRCSAAKENLRMYRNAIEVYTSQHNDVPPGFIKNTSYEPQTFAFILQLTKASNSKCQTADPGTPGYPFGPYFRELPKNPFNQKNTIDIIGNNDEFPAEATGLLGWICKPLTKEIRLDWPGTDSKGILYYDY
jgi:general secretion pathway protein G